MRVSTIAALSLFTLTALPLLASSSDADAVIRSCGTPSSEHQGISQVTNKMQRDLSYGSMILHFEPAQGGWTFLSGWYDHLPMTRTMVENRMPCFRDALQVSAAESPAVTPVSEDPTIRQQTTVPAEDTSTFGVPHLWLILILSVLVVLVYVFLPGRQRKAERLKNVEGMRRRRRPVMDRFLRRGSPNDIDV